MDLNTAGYITSGRRKACCCFVILFLVESVFGRYSGERNSLQSSKTGITEVHDINYLDQYVENYLENNHYTGATLGVARGNKLVYAKGYGTTRTGDPMEPTSLLPVSSISKTITSVAILKLVQDGHLHLTDKVFGPDGLLASLTPFPSTENADHRLHKITVEQLLHHTAGWSQQKPMLYDPLMNEVYLSRGHNVINISQEMGLTGLLMPKDVIRFMMGRKLSHAPGTTYEYLNFGYLVLGHIIQEVTWMSYEDYVKENVFAPLGMWQTRLRPADANADETSEGIFGLSFLDGEVPLFGSPQPTNPPIRLTDASLGWYSTVYDIMRFSTGIMDGSLLTQQTAQILLTPPASPMFEHQEIWPGLGVRVINTGAWWQVADPHDNEIVLYHGASEPPTNKRKPVSTSDDVLSWVIVLSSNNRKNLRVTFDEVFSSINWPYRNLFLDDCGMAAKALSNDEKAVLMNSKVPEKIFPAYANAMLRGGFHPTWISAYLFQGETFMSGVFRYQESNTKIMTHFGLVTSELKDKVAVYSTQGMQLALVNSYTSQQHHGHVMHTAIFSTEQKLTVTEFHKPHHQYLHLFHKYTEQGYVPTVQSIASRQGKQTVSFIFEYLGSVNWKSYTNLTLAQLDGVVRSNAVLDRTLHYLDSYMHKGELLFSAVFIDEGLHTWHFQSGLSQLELDNAASTYTKLGYYPKIMTGYEQASDLKYAVLWAKK